MWKRVVAPTVVVSILWIAVSLVTTLKMSELLESHGRAMSENVATIESAWALRRDVWKLQVAVLDASYRNTSEALAAVDAIETTFQNSLTEAAKTSLTPGEQALVQTIRTRFEEYRQHIHEQMQAGALSSENSAQLAAAREKTLRLALGVSESCRALSDLNQQLIQNAAQENQRLYRTVLLFRAGFLVLGPLVGLILGVWVARRMSRSISQISVTLNDATGKLSGELGSLAVSNIDELPGLHRQVEVVVGRIRQVVNELEATRQRAIQSERLAAVGELAAGLAHEIRNPLTSVKLLIQMASQRQANSTMTPQHFEILLQEISRMEMTIQGLLDFARPPRLQVVCHDVRQTVRRALNLVQGRARHQKVAVSEDFPDQPVMVDADPEQLNAVFVNLAINAIEAMVNGGSLMVSMDRGEGVCRVNFSDTGSGIPLQLLGRVFEPFVTGKDRGTGLGLAISRRIVEEHGGILDAANRNGGGAVLTVELKLSDTLPPDSDVHSDIASESSGIEYETTAHAKTSGH